MKTLKINCAGYDINADWYEGKDSKKILISLIGWTSSRDRYTELIKTFIDKTGSSALVVEYSGHGDSDIDIDTTRPAQHFLEVIYAFDFIKDKYPGAQISIIGFSYGGFMATQLTKYRKFENLILRAPAIYQPSDFYTLNSKIDRDWTNNIFRKDKESLSKHPLLARASGFAGNVLIMVHENDEMVPKETTDAYINAFEADVYLAKGFSHSIVDTQSDSAIAYYNAICDWFNSKN